MLWRDGRLVLTTVAMTSLMAVALSAGWASTDQAAQERHDAEHAARSQWEHQGDKNPHAAGHYGAWVFQPMGPLAAFDPGATPWLGASLELKAHNRALAGDAAARDATALSRFGGLSGAEVLFLLAPLVIISLGFGAWAAERESGTLRQLGSLGVRPRELLTGKAAGLLGALAMSTGPPFAVGIVVLLAMGADPTEMDAQATARVSVLAGFSTAYLLGWVGVTLAVSASARSTRAALVGLLAMWGVTSLLVPRAGLALADGISPPPTRESLVSDLRDAMQPTDREERVGVITKRLEVEEGIVDAGLFVDEATTAGVALRAEAAFESEAIDAVFGASRAQLAAHRAVARRSALASPYVAMRALSAALAGTNQTHHEHFSDAAELYRRDLIDRLDRYFAEHGGDKGWDFQAGAELWRDMPPFEYTAPDASEALADEGLGAVAVLLWLLIGTLSAGWTATRLRIV